MRPRSSPPSRRRSWEVDFTTLDAPVAPPDPKLVRQMWRDYTKRNQAELAEVERQLQTPAAVGKYRPNDDLEYQEFLGTGNELREELRDHGIFILWPTGFSRRAGLVEASLPAVPRQFAFTAPDGENVTVGRRELRLCLPRYSLLLPSKYVSPHERVILLQKIGLFASALHRRGYVMGGLSWTDFLFDLNQSDCAIAVVSYRRLRRIGHSGLWDQRFAPVGGMEEDRHDYALLAYRMLVALYPDAPLGPIGASLPVRGLSANQELSARRLWTRAASGPECSPHVDEWLSMLSAEMA